jgi:hypothetical protein
MEIIIGAFALVVIGYFVFFHKKDTPKTEAPYKVETPVPAGTEASIAAPTAPALDPVAVAIDLEPLQFSEPAKKPRKPRTVKTAVKTAAPKKVAVKKASPKKVAAIKAKPTSKKV